MNSCSKRVEGDADFWLVNQPGVFLIMSDSWKIARKIDDYRLWVGFIERSFCSELDLKAAPSLTLKNVIEMCIDFGFLEFDPLLMELEYELLLWIDFLRMVRGKYWILFSTPNSSPLCLIGTHGDRSNWCYMACKASSEPCWKNWILAEKCVGCCWRTITQVRFCILQWHHCLLLWLHPGKGIKT